MSDNGKSEALKLLEKQVSYKEAKIAAGESVLMKQRQQLSNIRARMDKLIKKEGSKP